MNKDECAVSVQGYLRMSGTSMAAPHVTGVVALLAHEHSGNPNLPEGLRPRDTKAQLIANSIPLMGQYQESTPENGYANVESG